MAETGPNLAFVRDGRSLGEWLGELISTEQSVRAVAGDAVAAMFFGVPSVHDELGTHDRDARNKEQHQAEFRQAVRAAVERDDFPRRMFFVGAAARLIGAHDDYMRQMIGGESQFDRVCERLAGRLEHVASDEERKAHLRRLGRALCAAIARDCAPDAAMIEALAFPSMMLAMVIPAAGPALLQAPEAMWMLIESPPHAHLVYEALERIGPAAAPQFLDHLLELFRGSEKRVHFDQAGALAALAAGNVAVIGELLEALQRGPVGLQAGAACTLYEMGESARAHPEALATLIRLTDSREPERRAWAAYALGGVARGIDDAVGSLLRLTYDPYVLEEGDGGHWVAGRAMTALQEIARQPEVVVPRLVEMFDTFVEFDPDMAYGGDHARVCTALAAFGPAALPVLPKLVSYLEHLPAEPVEEWNDRDVLELLVSFGRASLGAVPLLERLDQAWMTRPLPEEYDEDEEEEDEELTAEQAEPWSPYATVIRRLRDA